MKDHLKSLRSDIRRKRKNVILTPLKEDDSYS
jgi:hypothetical protein